MPISAEEIRRNLAEFAARWGGYHGTERAEAQTFLNQLLACYGTDRLDIGARFEEHGPGGFMDMIWPGVCIFEMKRPSEVDKLRDHREQALDYWKSSGTPEAPAPRWVVLCAFHRFEVWEPGAVFTQPRVVFDLADLPDWLDALLFLAGQDAVFTGTQAELTREAAAKVTDVLRSLQERKAADPDVLRDFALQCVWCMFAEDLQMLPAHLFTRVVDSLLREPARSSADDLGALFRYLNEPNRRPEHGLYAGVPYVDGALFAQPAVVHLERDEVRLLREACESPWHRVEPAIFGSLLEGALGRERQWSLGAHYTAEADILKVVLPTVVEPWREQLAACDTLARAEAAQDGLMNFVVLDPACGSGNFLYVAYRELRRIEAELRERIMSLRREAGMAEQGSIGFFPLTNLRGIEIEPFAVKLARVTLWMGHKLAVNELDLPETVLPLVDLSGIQRGDALKLEWPRADAIVGNPPYIGTKLMRARLGDDYVNWLDERFGIGVKDYVVYWFRKGHDHLAIGGRAGLVATNSIREGRNRQASLDYVAATGGVVKDAVSSQPWSGEANVHVSIVNWVKQPDSAPTTLRLDGADVDGITTALVAGKESTFGATLDANAGKQFFGVVPGGAGFLLTREEAEGLFAETEADYGQVVRPYLVGSDITNDPRQAPSRFIIDFHFNALEDAMNYPAALAIVRRLVKPHRDKVRRKAYREHWWRLEEPIVAMREALRGLTRYIACPAQAKRFYMIWCDPEWVPSNLTSVFTFEDDFAMGVLTSAIHTRWATAQSTTLETRPRYTSASFATFPWPQATDDRRAAIAEASRAVIARREEICRERAIGLTKLYNEVDEGAYRDLRELHDRLDEAVADAYGWPKSAAHDPAESSRRLLKLNHAIAAGEVAYNPF